MGFLDTLTKNLGFNQQEDPLKPKATSTPYVPGSMISKATGSGTTPFMSTLSKNLGADQIPVPTIPKSGPNIDTKAVQQSVKQFAVDVAQAFPRAVAQTAMTIGGKVVPNSFNDTESIDTTTNEFSKFLFGDRPLKTFGKQSEDIKPLIEKVTGKAGGTEDTSKNVAKYSAMPLVVVGSLLDLTGFGGAEKKSFEKVFKTKIDDFVRDSTKATSVDETYNLLRQAGLDDDIAKAKAPLFAETKTPKETKALMRETVAEHAQKVEGEATKRIAELESKKEGKTILDEATQQPIVTPPAYLSANELDELKYLKENIKSPEKLALAYQDTTPPPPIFSRERGYVTSAKMSDDISSDISSEISEFYNTKSNQGLVDNSMARLSNLDEAKKFADNNSTDEAVATRIAIDKHLSTEYKLAKTQAEKETLAKEIKDSIIKHARLATEEGRTVQANALLGKKTPEGMLRATSRKIDEYNKTAKTKIPQIDEKTVSDVLERSKKIESMPDGLAKEVEINRLAKSLERLIPTSTWQKVVHVWKAGLLTGIKTSGVNISSNFFNGVAENIKNIPATGVDLATSIFTGKRSKVLTLRGLFQGSKEGVKKGWNYLKTGVGDEAAKSGLEFNKVNFDSKPGKLLEKYAEGVYRVLGSEDMPFFYGALRRSLAEQALVAIKNTKKVFKNSDEKAKFIQDFIDNPSEKALVMADLDAKVATFKNDTALGKAATSVRNASPVAEVILPFAKTPSAVATAMFNYTPAGAIHTLYRNFIKGPFNQKDFAEGLGRAFTGSGALWLGSQLYSDGKISLEYPTGEKERAQWEATGKTPNSILIEGKWVPLVTFGPAGSVLGIGGYVQKGKEETGSLAGGVISGLTGGVKGLTEQTFLTGVKNLIDAINEPEKKGTSFVGGLAASVVPTIISDFNQASDEYQRKASGTLLGPLKARIPGVRENLPKKLDVWGQPLERNRTALATAISPIRLSNTIQGTLNTEVERLGQLGEDIRPTKVDAKIKNITLSPEEYYKYQRLYGNILTKGLTALVKNADYQKQDPEQQAKLWKNATSDIRKATSEMILPILIKQRYELPDTVDPKTFTEYVDVLYKKSPDFAKASPEKQKKVILKLMNS